MNDFNFNIGKKDGIWLIIDLIRELKYDDEFYEFYKEMEKEDVIVKLMEEIEKKIKNHFSEELKYGVEK